jgi:hypothetical protein
MYDTKRIRYNERVHLEVCRPAVKAGGSAGKSGAANGIPWLGRPVGEVLLTLYTDISGVSKAIKVW